MKKSLLQIFIFFLGITLVCPQTRGQISLRNNEADYIKGRSYYSKAVAADAAGLVDSTAYYIRKSLEISLNNSYNDLSADNYRLLGIAYDRIPDWENTLRNFLRAGTDYNLSGLYTDEAGIFDLIAKKYFSFGVYRKTIDYSNRSFRLYPVKMPDNKATSAELAGKSAYMFGDFNSAVKWFDTANVWYARQKDTTGITRSLLGSASSYLRILDASVPLSHLWTSNYNISSVLTTKIMSSLSGSMAMRRYESLLDMYKKKKDNNGLASIYNNIGYIYFRQEAYKKAILNFKQAIDYMTKSGSDKEELSSALTNLAICYENTGDEDLAMSTFNDALDQIRKSDDQSETARIDHLLAKIYLSNNDFYHAESYCKDCIDASKASGNYRQLQQCYQTFAQIEEKGNDFVKALEYFQRHLALRDSLSVADKLAENERQQRIQYYEDLEQKLLLDISDEDLRYLTIKKLRADSLSMRSELHALKSDSLSKHSEIMALRATAELKASEQKRLLQAYDLEVERNKTEQQQRDIMTLEQEKRINELTLKAQQDEQERLLQQVELEKAKRKTAIVFVILAIIIALSILGSLISSRSKNKKLAESKKHIEEINLDLEKKNSEISEQKEVIEQKNKSITDSIQYASRIQSAVLLPVNFMNEWGIDNFILFMPKDIVSGDFYWGARKKGKLIIAAADCTGHGVPGAFMSMLGNAFLNEIVNASEDLSAAAILNFLRDEVIRALKQKGVTGEARDGMDISLCVIDSSTMKGTFAGANNPLYLIRKGELIKVPADRMPIGIHVVAERPFAEQPVELLKGDAIYLFTDGYADQFGGPAGKKFMYRPFQDLLVSIASHPIEKQHEILKKTFIDWQGDYEQVDDVLVMGFKI